MTRFSIASLGLFVLILAGCSKGPAVVSVPDLSTKSGDGALSMHDTKTLLLNDLIKEKEKLASGDEMKDYSPTARGKKVVWELPVKKIEGDTASVLSGLIDLGARVPVGYQLKLRNSKNEEIESGPDGVFLVRSGKELSKEQYAKLNDKSRLLISGTVKTASAMHQGDAIDIVLHLTDCEIKLKE
ncbi:MAG: hypothetical protein K2R98_11610 [Gemmataceae bacterium]|nr:hypothetical protein [Gemmataceae bacterium]